MVANETSCCCCSCTGDFKKRGSLMTVATLKGLYVIAQIVVAIRSSSLVLLSDAFHNISDVISLGVAFAANVVRRFAHSSF